MQRSAQTTIATVLGVILAIGLSGGAMAQCLGRPDFDACMARINQGNQNRLAQAQQQTYARYMQMFGPWLRKQYASYRGPMTFQQFAYWNMMTANGTNVAGAMQAQQDQFKGMQDANATRQQGYSSYRQGMYANSERTSQTAERFDQGAIRGNTAQIDPRTGQKQWLPYGQPDNQPFTTNGQTYMRNQNGYFQWNGSGWTQMQPGR
jgi:hypothetical protein